LVRLRSDLLLPSDAPAARAAQAEAEALRRALAGRAEAAAAADWLRQRRQLGQEVFARGRPAPSPLTLTNLHMQTAKDQPRQNVRSSHE